MDEGVSSGDWIAAEGLHLLRWEEVSSQCVKEGRGVKLGGRGTGGQRYLRRLNMFFLCHVFLERACVCVCVCYWIEAVRLAG